MSQLEQTSTATGFVILIACVIIATFIFPGLIDTHTQTTKTESQIVELEKGESKELISSNYSVTLLSVNTSANEATYELSNENSTTFTSSIDENRTLMFSNETIIAKLQDINKSMGTGKSVIYNPIYSEGSGEADGIAYFAGDTADNEPLLTQVKINPNSSGYISNFTTYHDFAFGGGYNFAINIYLSEGNPNSSFDSSNLIRENYVIERFEATQRTIEVNETYLESGQNYTITFLTNSSNNDGLSNIIYINSDETANSSWYYSNQSDGSNSYIDIDVPIVEDTTANTNATSIFYINNFIDNKKANSLWQIVPILFMAIVTLIIISIGIPDSNSL